MKCVLLLAALAAPALAAAQLTPSAGQVIPTDPPNSDTAHGLFIDADECDATNALKVELSWNIPLTAATAVSYEVWAANKDPTTTGTGGTTTAKICDTLSNTNNSYTVGQVGQTLQASNSTGTVSFEQYPAPDFVTKAGFNCSDTALRSIFVCVQAKDSNSNANLGVAQVTLTLSTARPDAPTNVTATPADDTALKISWTAPSGTSLTYDLTWAADPPSDLDPSPHAESDLTATNFTAKGLAPIPYTFSVKARSNAGSRSLEAGTVTATPVPVADFWDQYQAAGGREQGGCAAGAAGPVALLGVAALLAVLRRRA